MTGLEAGVQELARNSPERGVLEANARQADVRLTDELCAARDRRGDPHRRARRAGDPRLHLEHVVEARGFSVAKARLDDRQPEPALLLEAIVVEAVGAPELDPRPLELTEVRRVVNDARLIGVLVRDANGVA